MNNTLTHSPAFDAIESSIANDPNLADSSKDKYIKSWQHAKLSGIDLMNPDQVSAYFLTLSPSAKLRFSAVFGRAVNIWQKQIRNGVSIQDVTPELFAKMQVAMWQMDDLREATPTHKSKGTKAHVWLSNEQVEQITALPDRTTLKGRRDWIVLGILFGTAVRRAEFGTENGKPGLTFDALKQQPKLDGTMRDVLEILHGKGDKSRVIPIQPLLGQRLREWQKEIGGGQIARSINRGDVLGKSLSTVGIYNIIAEYGLMIGVQLSPHDCRRTLNRIAYQKNKDILQLKEIDGHESIQTTLGYVGKILNLEDTPSDFVTLSGD